jgi:hypothetical protein
VSYLVRISVTGRGNEPVEVRGCLRHACKLIRRSQCFETPRLLRRRCREIIPDVLMRLGELRGLIYRSDRGRYGRPRTFVHFFETPVQLTCDPHGRQLHILGGNYRITRRGIEG